MVLALALEWILCDFSSDPLKNWSESPYFKQEPARYSPYCRHRPKKVPKSRKNVRNSYTANPHRHFD